MLFLAAIFLWSWNELKEYDVWYHLKTGEYILEHFSIPRHDIFSYTAFGARWVTHSWFAEVIFAFIYQFAGFSGLISFVALLSVAVHFLVYRLGMLWGANKYVMLFSLFLLPFFKTFSFFVPRPQIFSYFFAVFEILLLEKYLETKKRPYLYSILAMILLWANMHASVALGIFIFFLYAFFARELFFPALSSILLALLNPNTYGVLTYQFEIKEVADALRVGEWISIWAYRDFLGTQIFFLILAACNIFFIAAYIKERSSRNLRRAALAAVFSALPFFSVRHLAFFPLVALPLLSAAANDTARFRSTLQKIKPALLRVFACGIGILFLLGGSLRMPDTPVNKEALPVDAVDFIEVNGIVGPLFNLYHEGGYLIWRLWPKEKVFFDGRSEVYRGEPLADLLIISQQSEGWEDLIDKKYGINYFLLPYREPYTGFSIQLARAVLARGFEVVYLDETHLILLRSTEKNREIIKKFAIDIGDVVK